MRNVTAGAIIIKADKKSNKLLTDLAKKLGGDVINLADEQYEDFAIGYAMDSVKTGETIEKDSIILKLRKR
jgi:hypothetical protein